VQTEKVRVDVAVDLEFQDSKWAEILNEFRCAHPLPRAFMEVPRLPLPHIEPMCCVARSAMVSDFLSDEINKAVSDAIKDLACPASLSPLPPAQLPPLPTRTILAS
jgi:hypothetical protein